MSNPFVFIIGCPRSGTTLFGRMVDAHPEIAIIHELGWLARRYAMREGLTPDGLVTPAFVRLLLEKGFGRYERLPMRRPELEGMLAQGDETSYPDLVARLFDRCGQARGKRLVGNKTVDEARNIPILHGCWPQAKFVHLIRDGRDVGLSAIAWHRAEKLAMRFPTWRADPVSTVAAWWEWHVRSGRDAGHALGPELYKEVRYEALVARPAEELSALCAFLGVRYDDAMVRFHEGREQSGAGLDAKRAWLPPTRGLRDWRAQMPGEELERFEAVAGELLDELGYQRGADRPPEGRIAHAVRIRRAFEEAAEAEEKRRQSEARVGTTSTKASKHAIQPFGTLKTGTWVKVKGRRGEDRSFLARRISIRRAQPTIAIQGPIEEIQRDRHIIRVLGRTVTVTDGCEVRNLFGARISPRDLTAGMWVKLDGTYAKSTGLVPSSVKVRLEGDFEEMRGSIERLDGDGKTFDLLGVRVVMTDATEVKDRAINDAR